MVKTLLASSSTAIMVIVATTLAGPVHARRQVDAPTQDATASRHGEDQPVDDPVDDPVVSHARRAVEQGRRTFRFDTFGDETFWGDQLQLHLAIAGERFRGVGAGVSPRTALAVARRDVYVLDSSRFVA